MKNLIVAILGILLLYLAACVAPPTQGEESIRQTGKGPGAAVKQPVARPAWQEEWDKAVSVAPKEGNVVVYTSMPASLGAAIVPPLRAKYGINVEFVSGRTAEVIQKMTSERNAGLFLVDVSISGSSHSITQKEAGFTEPLEPTLLLPVVRDRKLWRDGDLQFVDGDRHILSFVSRPTSLLAYNAELVNPPVQSFRELLDPKWKGKIMMNDPTISGSGGLFATAMGEKYGVDFLKALVKQDPMVTRDQRLQVEWVARGKYALATGPEGALVVEFRTAGAPIRAGYPADHDFSSAGWALLSLISKRPHPNATAVFVNWFLSQEGQSVFVKASGRPSRRIDVSTEGVDPDDLLDPKKTYVSMETEEMARRRFSWMGTAKEIFGHLLK